MNSVRQWRINRREREARVDLVRQALARGTSGPLAPADCQEEPSYRKMREAMVKDRRVNGVRPPNYVYRFGDLSSDDEAVYAPRIAQKDWESGLKGVASAVPIEDE